MRKPVPAELDATPPIACTLDEEAIPDRLQDWAEVLAHVTERSTGEDGAIHLAFSRDVPLDELILLLAAEQACCSFFSFTVTIDQLGIDLGVRVPDDAQPVAEALFG